jgi:hypothetical protein
MAVDYPAVARRGVEGRRTALASRAYFVIRYIGRRFARAAVFLLPHR